MGSDSDCFLETLNCINTTEMLVLFPILTELDNLVDNPLKWKKCS